MRRGGQGQGQENCISVQKIGATFSYSPTFVLRGKMLQHKGVFFCFVFQIQSGFYVNRRQTSVHEIWKGLTDKHVVSKHHVQQPVSQKSVSDPSSRKKKEREP